MVNKSKNIGTACETAVVRYLNSNGWPSAERASLTGALDKGDITGCPGLCWEVKGGHAAETASDTQIEAWLGEAEREKRHRMVNVAVLVVKRRGKGASSAGAWLAVMTGETFLELVGAVNAEQVALPPLRMTLAHAVTLLRSVGFGTEL